MQKIRQPCAGLCRYRAHMAYAWIGGKPGRQGADLFRLRQVYFVERSYDGHAAVRSPKQRLLVTAAQSFGAVHNDQGCFNIR